MLQCFTKKPSIAIFVENQTVFDYPDLLLTKLHNNISLLENNNEKY